MKTRTKWIAFGTMLATSLTALGALAASLPGGWKVVCAVVGVVGAGISAGLATVRGDSEKG